MDFGSLGDYFEIVLAKRLSGTDIDKYISHGHELGGFAKLKPILGTEKRRLRAHYVYIDDVSSICKTTWTTWYNSRWNKPTRRPEYRLYYPDVEPVNLARTGDMTLACLTHDLQLVFIFVQNGCDREGDVEWLFGLNSKLGSFKPAKDMSRRIDAFGAEILEIIGIEVEVPITIDRYVDEMLDLWPDKFPAGRKFSSFARYVAGIDPREDPDIALVEYYNTQTLLFMEYEKYEHERRLGPLVRDVHEPNYDTILKVAMSFFQRRRSAAGHALEYHLEALFDARNILYTAQGLTEGKEKPDFIFPSIVDYHDQGFPSQGLTLLGAKTTAKDRWRQILQEGERIPRKHLITLEPAITIAQTEEMRERNLQLVVPKPIHSSYIPSQRQYMWTIGDFCEYVLELQAKYT